MPTGQNSSPDHVGGGLANVIFIFTLVAFVVESQLTQYVQTTLEYRQPYFLFYVVHSAFTLMFPLHLLYLTSRSGHTRTALLKGLSIAITDHFSSFGTPTDTSFPYYSLARVVLLLFVGLTCPALLWFAAVSLASLSDVTAIWNTNAFFAYLFTLKFLDLRRESRPLFAVVLATLGVMVVVYGGSSQTDSEKTAVHAETSIKPSAPLAGDLLTLAASIGYGLYQVLYKKYAALPSDPELAADESYHPIRDDDAEITSGEVNPAESVKEDVVYPLPFGLHPNLLISFVGLLTFIILWIPLPLLHYSGIQRFKLPGNLTTSTAIAGIALSGMVFNGGLVVLLGTWGPIITSVGNLLTIVLVTISDVLFGAGIENLTIWSVIGCSVITAAFGVLAYDMHKKRSSTV